MKSRLRKVIRSFLGPLIFCSIPHLFVLLYNNYFPYLNTDKNPSFERIRKFDFQIFEFWLPLPELRKRDNWDHSLPSASLPTVSPERIWFKVYSSVPIQARALGTYMYWQNLVNIAGIYKLYPFFIKFSSAFLSSFEFLSPKSSLF